jgi:hypothetical protein
MRWAAAVASVGLLLSAGPVDPVRATTTKPALQVTSVNPLDVRGQGFQAGERLTVLLTMTTGKVRRTVRATAVGTFRVVFPVYGINRCSDTAFLRAWGDRGSSVTEKLSRLACPRRR